MKNVVRSIFGWSNHARRARVLFILKRNEAYGTWCYSNRSSGLRHSAEFVSDMLNVEGHSSRVVVVTDNNDIDREVDRFRPDVVIIEALWVVPGKFDILKKLHPDVTWVVRVHSEIPFLANEGIAIEWLKGYHDRGVLIAPNSFKTFEDFISLGLDPVFLPNFYPGNALKKKVYSPLDTSIHIGCFGAIRPLKNQLIQAVAALRYANENGLILYFHINATRIEDNGSSALRNLRALFTGPHQLIEHSWATHDDFLTLLDAMDLAMSVSLSETFSIVTADAVSRRVPIVTSKEVVWADDRVKASCTNSLDITDRIGYSLKRSKSVVRRSLKQLREYSNESKEIWNKFLELER